MTKTINSKKKLKFFVSLPQVHLSQTKAMLMMVVCELLVAAIEELTDSFITVMINNCQEFYFIAHHLPHFCLVVKEKQVQHVCVCVCVCVHTE